MGDSLQMEHKNNYLSAEQKTNMLSSCMKIGQWDLKRFGHIATGIIIF